MNRKFIPHLWFDKEAGEAAGLYTSIFDHSEIKNKTMIHDTPSGDSEIISFNIAGQDFAAISAGPFFKFNPSISLFVRCDSENEVEKLWNNLSENGKVIMNLGKYPFSQLYGWLEDRYGLSWQIGLMEGESQNKITPTLMFTGDVYGRAREAVGFYTSVFHDSKVNHILNYGPEAQNEKEDSVMHASFTLEGYEFAAMDSGHVHNIRFNESISFIVRCKTQEEIDYFWDKLSAVPEAEQCGWLKDRFGVSWQIVPEIFDEMISSGDRQKISRVTKAFLKIKKFNIDELKKAYSGD